MNPERKKRLDAKIRRIDAKNKKTDKMINDFAEKLFKMNPKLIGVTICGIQKPSKFNNQDNNRVSGIFIENKNIVQKKK